MTATLRHPQRGHRRRSLSLAKGKSCPLVQTSVVRSSSVLKSQQRLCFSPSLPSSRQRMWIVQLKFQASPSVSIIEQTENKCQFVLSQKRVLVPFHSEWPHLKLARGPFCVLRFWFLCGTTGRHSTRRSAKLPPSPHTGLSQGIRWLRDAPALPPDRRTQCVIISTSKTAPSSMTMRVWN
jgi:hypothetical protein